MYILDVREGVAGDMILSAFIDSNLVPLKEILIILEKSAKVMDPSARVNVKNERIRDETGTSLNVSHRDFDEIKALSIRRHLNHALKELHLLKYYRLANAILDTILNAEANVHSVPIGRLHLHETGSPDTLVDIIGASYFHGTLRDDLICTSIAVGSGKVSIAHGIFNVPPPATLIILDNMKWFRGPYKGEMATPTGTAILRNIAPKQVKDIEMRIVKLGTGFGSKTFSGRRTAVRLYKTQNEAV